jgi:DNA-binding NtrC family response regulator
MSMSVAVTAPVLLAQDEETRRALLELLREHQITALAAENPTELLLILKGGPSATVFVDCQALESHGGGLFAKIRVAAPAARLVLLCERRHQNHRRLVRDALEMGIYACLLAPYEGYEVLTLVRPHQGRKPPVRRTPPRKGDDQ